MKILFVTHRYPPRTGGVETHIREIATRLVDRGHDVTVFSADVGDDVPDRSIDEGVRVRRFRSLSPDKSFYFAPQIALAVRRANADVVHAHNYHAFPLFFSAMGVTDERFIMTTHYHGESASGLRDVLLSAYRRFGRWAIQQADEVIAVSEWEQKRLREDFGVDAMVVPNGIDVKRFAEAKPEDREYPYMLCVGRLKEYKGVQYVIRSLSELPEYELVVAGSGSYRGELERIARDEGVPTRVDLIGYVEDERLDRLYAGADVYVTMSEFEAYGITIGEALAAGTPCVVREARALKDWTDREAVFGVRETGAEKLAEAVSNATSTTPSPTSLTTWEETTKRSSDLY